MSTYSTTLITTNKAAVGKTFHPAIFAAQQATNRETIIAAHSPAYSSALFSTL